MRKIIATTAGAIMKRHGVTAETLPAASRATQERVLWEARQECARHGATIEELSAYLNISQAGISRLGNSNKRKL